MDGWTVLRYIYLIGLAFIALWILGTCRNEGLWGNALMFLTGTWPPRAPWRSGSRRCGSTLKALAPKPDDQLLIVAVAMGLFWILFLALFTGRCRLGHRWYSRP